MKVVKKCDLHMHTEFSPDSSALVDDMCGAAVERGLEIIAFTDHFELTNERKFCYKYYLEHEARRIEEIAAAREKYDGRLEILYGAEIGQPHLFPEVSSDFLNSRKFDFILGSVHILPGERDLFMLDYFSDEYTDSIINEYFDQIMNLIEFGGFDSLAHLDLPLRMLEGRFEKPTVIKYQRKIDKILRAAADKGLGLEINTRGLFGWQGAVGPEPWVLRRFLDFGGKFITIGSDAHNSSAVGNGVEQAISAAKNAGFSAVTYFKDRKPIKIEI